MSEIVPRGTIFYTTHCSTWNSILFFAKKITTAHYHTTKSHVKLTQTGIHIVPRGTFLSQYTPILHTIILFTQKTITKCKKIAHFSQDCST